MDPASNPTLPSVGLATAVLTAVLLVVLLAAAFLAELAHSEDLQSHICIVQYNIFPVVHPLR